MDIKNFENTLKESNPPAKLSAPLQGLWYDAKGDWHKAHEAVQDDDSSDSAWVHAYLHRKEGDKFNARYWYNRAGKPSCKDSLEVEWIDLVKSIN